MEAKSFASASLRFCSLLLYIATRVSCQCDITGCAAGECYLDGGQNKCRRCLDGYYRTSTTLSCNPCQSRCRTCELFAQCSSCKAGFYLDTAQSFCGSCPTKCLDCDTSNSCAQCEEGLAFNLTAGACTDGSGEAAAAAAAPKKKSSLVGQIIGYCVSGVVLVLCCVITLLHQKRKQEEEEAARRQHKLEQEKLQAANHPRDEHEDGAGEWEFDSLKRGPQFHGDFLGLSPAKVAISPGKKMSVPVDAGFDASQPGFSKARKPIEPFPDPTHAQAKFPPELYPQAGQPSPDKAPRFRPTVGASPNLLQQTPSDSKLVASWQTGAEVANNNSPTLKVMVKKPREGLGLNLAPSEPQTQPHGGVKTNSRVSVMGAQKS